jgi:CO/xanthine dehydrogenase Mo-binding subunit
VPETKLVGQNYTTPDLVAKVTGTARYAEDYRAEGMLFCKLLLSPMPHARIRRIDSSKALAMKGVVAILTADDFPPVKPDQAGLKPEQALTNEPVYQGEPILAVAAVDEVTAADAIEQIDLDLEPLPFVVDPIESLRPEGPNARLEGNAYVNRKVDTLKWTAEDFREVEAGRLPFGKGADEWKIGDVDAGFTQADIVIDETVVIQSTGHQPLETRTAMAYWQNGKLYLHGSTQSVARTVASVAGWVGVPPSQVVIISEYTGGGFGSKIPGAHSMAIPALLAKKTGRPVMMRISREEEHFIGRARAGMQARAKLGMRKDGRITALDLYIVMDNGPYSAQGDARSAGSIASLAYQPMNMRFRSVAVLTNTPPRTSQRSPGGMQANAILEPIITKAARKLGLDQVAVRRVNAPAGKAFYGPPGQNGKQRYVTSAFVKEALDRGVELFGWDERKARSGKRRGSKARGIGVAVGPYVGGSIGFDAIMTIRPDGRLYFQSGIGNLGTHSTIDVHRVAAELLGMPWDKCEVSWGDTSKHVPWSCVSAGSQTVHAMTRAAHAGAMDARQKLQEIAARDLGGQPDDYEVSNERVHRKGNPNGGLTFAQAAKRAIELGGKYDGHELPKDINPMTKTSATALAGLGLMGVAKDNYPRDGDTHSYVVGFAEVEVDVETGAYQILDYTAVADCGTILHPNSLGGQIHGGSVLGMGHAIGQRWTYDQHYGRAVAKRFHHTKPPTILDVPVAMKWDAVNLPDPETPVGARGIGEPPVGAGCGAVLNALVDALGDDAFRRMPVTPDVIVAALDAGKWTHEALTAHV